MIERLLPDSVAAVWTRKDAADARLFPQEERVVARAVEKRRREFVSGRACSRLALGRLGIAPVAIPRGDHGEPLWPSGIVGSITHCCGYRAAAVARADDVLSLGIDAEVDEPIPDEVLEQVAFGAELTTVAGRAAGVCLDKLLFSAKEAVYKAWFPLTGRWLGFEDVELTIDQLGGRFCAKLLVEGPRVSGVPLTTLRGRWCVQDGIVATAVVVLPGRAPL